MIKKNILIIILILGFFSCTPKKELEELEQAEEITPSTSKAEISKAEIKEIRPIFYTYSSYGKRDPFVPLMRETHTAKEEIPEDEKKEKVALNLKNVFLIGVISDKKDSMALLCDNKENGYVLKQGLLYDDKGNELKGIKGIIRKDYVILEQNKKLHTIALSSYIKKEEKSSEDIQENKQEESIKEEW